jgi:hypothetical protein
VPTGVPSRAPARATLSSADLIELSKFQRSGTMVHAGSGSARQSVEYILALGKRASLFGRLR